ncbi:transglycosylase SLT domain-containing protein [Pseudonocardia kujensis]|uniref:transglycosylase SLT domain-containing protein n=1 Tax=Pseudonocardia kujensis TaxID=1128675 RepID=UPI001E57AFDC|nr:transglycosylase SLT domain-containing protein [Pseudonocardia kujensis]MCE0768650.1 transglycosylase SLT domain-containing protein [Pseudonocardia kujensis]
MAGHRSPGGRRVTGDPAPHRVPAKHAARHATAPGRAAPRRTVASTTAAVGAAFGVLSTGTFAAVTSTGVPAIADAAETSTAATQLTASSEALKADPADVPLTGAHLSPVAYSVAGVNNGGDTAQEAAAETTDTELASLDKAGRIADQIAEQQAKEAAAAAAKAKLDALIAQGGVDGWIAQALEICDLPQDLAPGVKKVIMAESGGNPRAINLWDSNARSGNPSQGLMQVIPATFRAYVHPSLAGRSITDPVANITAGVRYMIANYGMDTLEAGGRSNSAGSYVGY